MEFTPEYAATFANTPSGQSTAAAIVTSCLFLMFLVLMLPSYFITKYPYYDVLAISCVFRSIGYASRAAYLGGTYRPALQGVYLAFANAGYGVSIAVLTLGVGSWFNRVDRLYFPLWLHQTLRTTHFLLIIPVIAFGPINGVVAAGLLFGDYHNLGSWIDGFKCRRATSWGLWGVNTTVLLMVFSETIGVLLNKTQPKAAKFMVDQGHPQRKPELFVIFLVCAMFLEVRGTFNLIADYKENYFLEDKLWYPLNPLLELMELAIMCFPLLFAQMAQAWPKSEPQEKSKADKTQNISKQADGKRELSNGTVKASAPGSQGSSMV